MRFKVDENLPDEVAALFSLAGYDCVTVCDEGLGGRSDADISAVCRTEDRILVTMDKDFANVRAYPPGDSPGFMVLRLSRQDKPHVLKIVARTLPVLEAAVVSRRLWIVEDDRIRIHGE